MGAAFQSKSQTSHRFTLYLVLVFVNQLFTFSLLTLPTLVNEITLGLCPGDATEVHLSGSVLFTVLDGAGLQGS